VNFVLLSRIVVAWWCSGESVGFATQKVAGLIPSLALSGNNLEKVECSHTHASITKQYNLVQVKGQ